MRVSWWIGSCIIIISMIIRIIMRIITYSHLRIRRVSCFKKLYEASHLHYPTKVLYGLENNK